MMPRDRPSTCSPLPQTTHRAPSRRSLRESEQVRSLFIALFDETTDVVKRIEAFKTQAEALLKRHPKVGKNHYQDENTITTYLWLRYPDTDYI